MPIRLCFFPSLGSAQHPAGSFLWLPVGPQQLWVLPFQGKIAVTCHVCLLPGEGVIIFLNPAVHLIGWASATGLLSLSVQNKKLKCAIRLKSGSCAIPYRPRGIRVVEGKSVNKDLRPWLKKRGKECWEN